MIRLGNYAFRPSDVTLLHMERRLDGETWQITVHLVGGQQVIACFSTLSETNDKLAWLVARVNAVTKCYG